MIRTEATLVNVARSAGITLTSFDVRCFWNGAEAMRMQTTFGFFRKDELARQAGLPAAAGGLTAAGGEIAIDLADRPDRYFAGPLRLPSGNLLMLDRITALEPKEHGWVRAEKDVRPSDWFFKAHFYQDPVQPGSLGLEAIVQALEFYVIHGGLAAGIPSPAFVLDGAMAWKYRGQVLPPNRRIAIEVRLKSVARTGGSVAVRAEGWLWVDGTRIYHFSDFGLQVVPGNLP